MLPVLLSRLLPSPWILAAALLAHLALCLPARAEPVKRPNIVLILADDLGYGDLGSYGNTKIHTPHLDRMAAQGLRFTDFYVAQSVCTASRAALLTGCYPNRIGMSGALNHTSTTGIHPKEKLLSELLKTRGYATAAYGKWHLGHQPAFWPTNRGFDEFFGIPYSNDNGPLHPVVRGMPGLPLYDNQDIVEINPDQSQFTRRITERAVRFIEQKAGQPFFLYVPHVMPHVPLAASAAWKGKSAAGLYGDVVEELDWSVGQILGALQRKGIDEETLVVFLSDNGPFLSYGEHAGSPGLLREGKLTTFEGGMRTPCLMRWPGKVLPAAVTSEIACTMDLFVAITQFAGAPLSPNKIDGIDLRPLILGKPNAKGRDSLLFYSGKELHALRKGDWKLHIPHDYLTTAAEPGRDGKPSNLAKIEPSSIEDSGIRGIATRHGYRVESLPLSLYNLKDDPAEKNNLAQTRPALVAEMLLTMSNARLDLGDSLTNAWPSGVRPAGEARLPLPERVKLTANVEFSRPGGEALLLDLYLPIKKPETPIPVLVWIHGGGWQRGGKEDCSMAWLVAEGFAVASINYRSSIEAKWPAQFEDCRAALQWIQAHGAEYQIDPTRIFAAGSSAGGHIAAMLGTADLPRALRPRGVVDLFGPTDLLTMPENLPGPDYPRERLARSRSAILLGGVVSEMPDLARAASPLHRATQGDSPFLILHGDLDLDVPINQSERLRDALRNAGIPASLRVVRGGDHGGPAFQKPDVRKEILAFLRNPDSADSR